jgi:hypothetical protein
VNIKPHQQVGDAHGAAAHAAVDLNEARPTAGVLQLHVEHPLRRECVRQWACRGVDDCQQAAELDSCWRNCCKTTLSQGAGLVGTLPYTKPWQRCHRPFNTFTAADSLGGWTRQMLRLAHQRQAQRLHRLHAQLHERRLLIPGQDGRAVATCSTECCWMIWYRHSTQGSHGPSPMQSTHDGTCGLGVCHRSDLPVSLK